MVKRICPVCEQVMKGRHYCEECRGFVRHPRVIDVNYYLNERHSGNEGSCEYHNPSFMRSAKAEPAGAQKFPKLPGALTPTGRNYSEKSQLERSRLGRNQIGRNQLERNQAGGSAGRKNGNIGLVVAAVAIIIFFLNLILPLLMFAI